MAKASPSTVLFYLPNLIGYARIGFVLASFYVAETDWKTSVLFYTLAFAGDAVDGHVARMCNQASQFGAVLDMVTDRCSTAGLLLILSRLWGDYAFAFLVLMFVDLFSHWMHVQSVKGHHKASDSLTGRNFVLRCYYGVYPFFAYCCVFTEFFYITLYLLFFVPDAAVELPPWAAEATGGAFTAVTLHAVCWYLCFPACCFKQAANIAQLCAAAYSLAESDVAKTK